jgi:hypothetical protein
MKCKKKIQIGDTIYTANTSYKTAIKCNEIATDEHIGDFERALAIICTVFGDKALDRPEHHEKLLKWIQNFLSCGKEIKKNNEEPDMDYIEDMDYIITSFQSDYGINLDEEDMDWRRFNNLIEGLSNSEFGNCCVLNRIRNLRNYDVSQIKDKKERNKVIEAKKRVALKKNKKENHLTSEQEKSMANLNKLLGL